MVLENQNAKIKIFFNLYNLKLDDYIIKYLDFALSKEIFSPLFDYGQGNLISICQF